MQTRDKLVEGNGAGHSIRLQRLAAGDTKRDRNVLGILVTVTHRDGNHDEFHVRATGIANGDLALTEG